MTWDNLENRIKISKSDKHEPRARPPRLCKTCGSTWEYLSSPYYNKLRKKKYRPWKYLVDFPKIGCLEDKCPYCLNK